MNSSSDGLGMHEDEGRRAGGSGATVEARIECTLVEVSSWPASDERSGDSPVEETTPLWKYALAKTDSERGGSVMGPTRGHGVLARVGKPTTRRALGVAAGVLLLVVGTVVMLPQLGRARMGRMPVPQRESQVAELRADPWQSSSSAAKRIEGYKSSELVLGYEVTMLGEGVSADLSIDPHDRAPADVGAMDRQVARNGSISVEVEDVNAAMARIARLASEVHSEFVERSTLHGADRNASAEVVLRIASSRLDTVLGSIRAMGRVTAESIAAEDVTAQVVDIEARLHNERRVEIELLDLLDERTDAPLREVLDLRDKLREVRSEIERMQAARDRLSRLVSLSTLTVSISATPEEPKEDPAESSFFKPLTKAVAASWHDGLSGLTGSVAWLVRVAVGGLLWWALIVGSIIAWRRLGHVKHLPA